ncbi:hypothetical protein AB1Y20_016352 [Prymnesium parvum]|uniref:DUF2470 domain-containing protein n=1 Tax=Prymnesium parvum TaxID=97485 RepID=A0AB34IDR1_PRYPA
MAFAALSLRRAPLSLSLLLLPAEALVLQRSILAGGLRAIPLRHHSPLSSAAKGTDEDRLGAGGRGGHAVTSQPELSEEEQKVQAAVMEHQRNAARLSQAEDARSLVAYSTGYAVLSTLSSAVPGYPSGSLVGFAQDEAGLPIFCFSGMSSHTKDLLAADGGKAALCVTAKGFEGAADGRVTLIGDVERCSKEETERDGLRELYQKKHPNAFWVDFGDFAFFRMRQLKAVNFVGGFARAGVISPEDFLAASVDPIQAFAAPVMGHMNEDHSDSTIAMVQHYIGLPQVEKAELVQLDRLGFMVQVSRLGQSFKLRLPFPRPAENRKDVKTLIVQMTQESLADPEVQAAMKARQTTEEATA